VNTPPLTIASDQEAATALLGEIAALCAAQGAQWHPHLRAEVAGLPALKLHVFGHIHSGFGVYEEAGTTFVNAAVLDDRYLVRRQPPFVFRWLDFVGPIEPVA
jgi:hypothetical protein